jgi:EAL and modified HD-GYP domain-containing signal transduction protein
MDVFVARQPIFDSHQHVYGYELLYRSGSSNVYEGTDGSQASLSVIRNAFLMLGPQALTGRKKAFINFTKDLLLSGVALSLPQDQTVVEILEDIEPDESLLNACRDLKQAGFTLALDDYTLANTTQESFLQLADIVKVDFKLTSEQDRWKVVKQLSGHSKQLLAEKVETRQEFKDAANRGYALFQGYFFSKPVIVSGKDIPTIKLNYMQVVKEVNRRELDFYQLEKVIKQDTSLCYTLLNYINSAYFGLREHITSIRHAMVLLGESEVRKWASLVLFTFIGNDRPPEVIVTSLIRARMCEALANHCGLKGCDSELFFVGMFSMLDVLIGRPLREILGSMRLSNEVKNALLGMKSKYREVFELVVNYQNGNWERFERSAKKLSLNETIAPKLYLESVDWADRIASLKSDPEAAAAS